MFSNLKKVTIAEIIVYTIKVTLFNCFFAKLALKDFALFLKSKNKVEKSKIKITHSIILEGSTSIFYLSND